MNFNDYFLKYITNKGIKKVHIADLLNVSYSTLRTKFDRDSFNYKEILFLEQHYCDLNYVKYYNERQI